MQPNSRRLSILSATEIDDLYQLPRFTEDDRHLYFDLSEVEQEVVRNIRTFSVAVYLILQLGYFKAKHQFFAYGQGQEPTVLEDLHYIMEQYFPDKDFKSLKVPSRPIHIEQHRTVLRLFKYHLCDSDVRTSLENKAQRIAMLSTQPIYIFRELVQYLTQQRIILPSYRYLQEMIGHVIANEHRRLSQLLSENMTKTVETQLDALLHGDSDIFDINTLKHEAKDFSYAELRREVACRQFFQPLYEFGQHFLIISRISNESEKHYASLVKFYTSYKLRHMTLETARLYLLCFACQRFRQINDNLIEAFIHWVDRYESQAKTLAKEAMQSTIIAAAENLQAAGQVLSLFVDTSITDDTPFSTLKEKAFALLGAEHFPLVTDYMRNITFDKLAFEWSHYTKLSATFKLNLRQLFSDLRFTDRVENSPLLEAIEFLQKLLQADKSPRQVDQSLFPEAVIPSNLRRYLFSKNNENEKILNIDRYEFLVYRLLRNALKAGDIFVKDSTEFRCFEDDLINDQRWKNKDAVLREIGAPLLLTPIKETLVDFQGKLEAKIRETNQHITDGINKHIKIQSASKKRRWQLIYPQTEESTNHSFYGQIPGIGVADLLWFVAEETNFLSAFSHILDRYVKHNSDLSKILACIVAMGTNMGTDKMAETSGLSAVSLGTTVRNYLRLETLRAANDAITNATAKLPAFHLYDIQDNLHSSSDGQRMETQIDTVNARYSPKYFGLHKGVSAITLVTNHVPINAKIIGTHEHESHYVFDLLQNNTSEIKPERHSTDTHGTNQVNFWILHVFGYSFAPRYRDLHKKMETLVGFQQPTEYSGLLIKPSRKVNEELIEKEWPNIQRIMASLAQNDVTQATIVRKLASYERQNRTQKALWELDNICRTLYILEFIDDVELRQGVQKALNRGEAYHRFRRAVSFVNGGKFRVKTESEQQIWNECSRLIANAAIYYNMVLLSRVYEQKLAVGDQEALTLIQGISPVAWQHFNFFGSFDFSPSNSKVNIDTLVAFYADPAYWSKILTDERNLNC